MSAAKKKHEGRGQLEREAIRAPQLRTIDRLEAQLAEVRSASAQKDVVAEDGLELSVQPRPLNETLMCRHIYINTTTILWFPYHNYHSMV